MPDRALTIQDVTERFGVGAHTVLGWIRSGELAAIDVSRKRGRKPRWRITAAALSAFEAARTATPSLPRKRRKQQPADVIEFY